MNFNQTPMRKSTLVRKKANGRIGFYQVNIGKYEDSYVVWCCWGTKNPKSDVDSCVTNWQMKLISDNMIKILVKYYDIISRFIKKGYSELLV